MVKTEKGHGNEVNVYIRLQLSAAQVYFFSKHARICVFAVIKINN